ncbi:hypothetical protein ACIQXF_06765, partial [Lysinibacillus sp. NPDC097231]|uniref:hypothetical protein n=1 Tax=Lysinibacillus sp. NPDC097231 TaxID=3364142 RepID=UPI003820AAB1
SGSGKCFLRESKAAAANVFCAKAKRQRQMFSARKQSGSGTILVTQAFSQDVKVLACVPLFNVGDEENPAD